jgi:hypothetical protein
MSDGTQDAGSDAPGRTASTKPPIGDSPGAADAFKGSSSADDVARESPETPAGDLDTTSVDQGLTDAVASGPLTDGADQKQGREGEHDTGLDTGHEVS